ITEVLELPLAVSRPEILPLATLVAELVQALSRKRALKRNEGTWLVFQIAYLHALDRLIAQEQQLGRAWLERASVPAVIGAQMSLSDPQLQALLKTLRPGRLSDTQAEQAFAGPESFLLQQINSLAIAWLVANGAEPTEAQLLIQRLEHGLPGDLIIAIAENAASLAQLQKFVGLGTSLQRLTLAEKDDYDSLELAAHSTPNANLNHHALNLPLNLPREVYRATLIQNLSQPWLEEAFAIADLYVPLRGIPLALHTPTQPTSAHASAPKPAAPTPLDLIAWAHRQLEETASIAVIEAEAGQGKSCFCQIWAAQIARDHYPNWMPVLIRLRDAQLGQTLVETLNSVLPLGRFTESDGWLAAQPPCLLLLDGLEELPRSPQFDNPAAVLLRQIAQFQAQWQQTNLPRPKIVLTSQPGQVERWLTSHGSITPTPQFHRLVLQPLDQEELKQWFKHWSTLQSKPIAQAYFNLLKKSGIFRTATPGKEIATLARRPLWLYLLGLLHRDGLLEEEFFALSETQAKFELHDRLSTWLIGAGAPHANPGKMLTPLQEGLAHAGRGPGAIAKLLQGQQPYDVCQQLYTAALALLQSGQHHLPVSLLPAPLTASLTRSPAASLPALYFHRSAFTRPTTPQIEFSHHFLGDYLGAQAIAAQLRVVTQQVRDPYCTADFQLRSPTDVAQHLYKLLGYGLLSEEIESYIIQQLRRDQQQQVDGFNFRLLFERLSRFYQAYGRGQWLDEGITHQTRIQLQTLYNPLTILQIEAAVGLNVFLLLCACQREAQIPFWPCGDPQTPHFYPEQLLRLSGSATSLGSNSFWERVRDRLSGLQLAGAHLQQINLATADLSQANLAYANLTAAHLAGANLQAANLTGANLAGADLSNADLTGAKLTRANLQHSNLLGATLFGADLTEAQLSQARLDTAQPQTGQPDVPPATQAAEIEVATAQPQPPTYNQASIQDTAKQAEAATIDLAAFPLVIESAEGEPIPSGFSNVGKSSDETLLIDESTDE
ncbi:MAG TPA: pentapeptide repeat-containing protein, partial [Allocoleopsis sp.]